MKGKEREKEGREERKRMRGERRGREGRSLHSVFYSSSPMIRSQVGQQTHFGAF